MRKLIKIDESSDSINIAVKKAVAVLNNGGILLYPTDTVYGFGVDTENNEAVKKLYKLKKREENKQMSIIVADLDMAEKYAVFNEKARALARAFWPGALTLILPSKSQGTIGVRVPGNKFCLELLRIFGRPIISTSANISGTKSEHEVNLICKHLDANANKINLIIDQGILLAGKPSTIIDLSASEIKILRIGDLSNVAEFTTMLYK